MELMSAEKLSSASLHCSPHCWTLKAKPTTTFCKHILKDAREVIVLQLRLLDLTPTGGGGAALKK